MASATDAELLELARAGDERAFGLLVNRYEGAVAATAVGMLGAGDDADDVGQETFIRFFRSLHRFRGDSSLKTYLVHIAMNLSLNTLRKRRRALLRFVRADDEEHGMGDAPDPRRGPDGDIAGAELREIVQRAVSRLSPKHRAVVVLRLFHDYSTIEAARILAVPQGTVLSRLSRAMRELQRELAPYVRESAELPETVR